MRHVIKDHQDDSWRPRAPWARPSRSLQVALWSLWTLAVAATAYLNWYADLVAQQPVDLTRLVIYCLLVGVVGLVVTTVVEMRLEPWRFLD